MRTVAETWDVMIEHFITLDDEKKQIVLTQEKAKEMVKGFIGENPDDGAIRAFIWYLLYNYNTLKENGNPKVGFAVNAVLGTTAGVSHTRGAGVSKWEILINIPKHGITVPEDKKVLISEWLTAKGMADHATSIGL